MIRATSADGPAIKAFLTDHIATSMFPLANLHNHGMNGGHPRAVTFWLRWQAGRITDALAMTDEGFLFPQCPTGPWGDIRSVLAGNRFGGILGEAAQVRALRAVLAPVATAALDNVEPLYQLDLADLALPDCTGFTLRPLSDAPRSTVIAWRAAYHAEVMPMQGKDDVAVATDEIEAYLQADSHRLLFRGETPVAMTGFNAQLADSVQIGGVYTPPDMRGQGLARRAVGLHLREAREGGTQNAVLFAANAQAARAYEAIGFTRIGAFAMLMFEEPQVIHV